MFRRCECCFRCRFIVVGLVVLQPQAHRRSGAPPGGGARTMGRREKRSSKPRLCDTASVGHQFHKFPVFSVVPFIDLSSPPRGLHRSLPQMARTSGSSPLWKETPSTNMKKAQLLDIANAKEARIIHLRRKNSTCRTSGSNLLASNIIQPRGKKGRTERCTSRTRCCPGNSGCGAAHHHDPHPKTPWHQWPWWFQPR